MSHKLDSTTRNQICVLINNRISEGGINSSPKLQLFDISSILLIEWELDSSSAFNAPFNGIMEGNNLPLTGFGIANGIPDYYKIINKNEVIIITGDYSTVGKTGPVDIIIPTTNISIGGSLTLAFLKYISRNA